MVSSVLAVTFGYLVPVPDVGEQQAREIADEYRLFAASAGGTAVVGLPPSDGPVVISSSPPRGEFELKYPDGLVWVNKKTGRVTGITLSAATGFSVNWDNEHALSQAQVTALANAYYSHAGFVGTVSVSGMVADNDMGGPPNVWHAVAKQSQSGIELYTKYDIPLYVEHVSGRLVSIQIPEPPLPCANTTADISAITALFNFTQYIHNKTGESNFIVRIPMHPVIWVPDADDLTANYNELTPAYNIYKQNNQGYLIYWCNLESTQSSMGKGLPRWYFGHVDAHTGAVLGAFVPAAFGAKEDKPKPAIGWNLGPGIMEVSQGKKTIKVSGADVVSVPAQKKQPAGGMPVLLRRGTLMIFCLFDAKTGLVWKERDGRREFGKPNKNLLACLRRMK